MAELSLSGLVLGMVQTNVYFAADQETLQALIIDPADEAVQIRAHVKEKGLIPKAILLTHGHFDHMAAAADIRAYYDIPIYCHEAELPLLKNPRWNRSGLFHTESITLTPDKTVKEGDELTLAGLSFRVLHTPGHTEGSCCYYFPGRGILISGDTLFRGSYGRTDLPTGSDEKIAQSVRRLLRDLPVKTLVYPGHGMFTQIGLERQYNPLAEAL